MTPLEVRFASELGRRRPAQPAPAARPEPAAGLLARPERTRLRAPQRPGPGGDRGRGAAQARVAAAAARLGRRGPVRRRHPGPLHLHEPLGAGHARLRARGRPARPRHADPDPPPRRRPPRPRDSRIALAYREPRELHVAGEQLWRRDGSSFPVEYWSHPMWDDGVHQGSVGDLLRHHRPAAHAGSAAPGRGAHDRPRRRGQRRRDHGRRRRQGGPLQPRRRAALRCAGDRRDRQQRRALHPAPSAQSGSGPQAGAADRRTSAAARVRGAVRAARRRPGIPARGFPVPPRDRARPAPARRCCAT